LARGGPFGENTPGILACFIDGDAARDIGWMTLAARQSIILNELAVRFDTDRMRQLSKTITPKYVESISQNMEWIRGDYASTPGPRVLTPTAAGWR
jgi:hypothetical protein